MKRTLSIVRRWNNPQIKLWIDDREIGIEMSLEDFVAALADEAADPLAASLAVAAGNPAFLVTTKQLETRLAAAVDSAGAREIFAAATEKILSELKKETRRIV